MNTKDFKNHVDLYSADLSRWPMDLIKPALALVDRDATAKAYFEDALALDATLRTYDAPRADLEKLEARILSGIRARPAPQKRAFIPAALFAPGGGLLAALILGLFIGFHPPQVPDTLADAVFFAPDQVINDTISNEDF